MFGSIFSNMPNVVKNLLIINALFLLATFVLQNQGIDLHMLLGLHYPDSPNFRPYQLATHFFMHGDFWHLLFNMFSLVLIGSFLERLMGPKRFLMFYFLTALGASILYLGVEAIEINYVTGSYTPVKDGILSVSGDSIWSSQTYSKEASNVIGSTYGPLMGASGATYALVMAFAYLFPNTEFMLLFPPIPIKAKWFALILALIAFYNGYVKTDGDSVAHMAHLGGMLFGFILIKIWQKDRSNFY